MSDPADVKKKSAAIAERALAFEGAARVAFIQGLCLGDPVMASAVQKYLAQPKQAVRSAASTFIAAVDGRKKIRRIPIRVLQNRYELKQLLGAGGMGQVFRALDRQTGAQVAIKVIKADGALGQDERMRFVREARSAGQLRHPNIVQIYDIGQIEGNLFMVMEYLPGLSLRALISNGPRQFNGPHQDPRPMLLIVSQVASALAFAHAEGVIHADVKPENIMVLRDGSAKLVDFGIARHAGRSNSLVQGATPSYAAPEQFQHHDAHAPSDVWSTGVTLFESLTGRRPFQISEIVHAPTPPLDGGLLLSAELNRLLAKVLAKNPQHRPIASEVATALSDLAGQPPLNREKSSAAITIPDHNPARKPRENSDGLYSLPDLGFRSSLAPEGDLKATEHISTWDKRRLSVERVRKQFLSPTRIYLAFGLCLSPLLLLLVLGSFQTGIVVMLIAGALVSCFVLLTFLPTSVCLLFCAFAQLPRCLNCRLSMRRTSSWMRFAKDRTEVSYGLSDCTGALKHGLWQEAAKLLAVHGRENVAEYDNYLIAPLRIRLNFFECDRCPHHAARLTIDQRTGKTWRQQERYFEAYWRGAGTHPSLVLRIVNIFKNSSRAFAEATRIKVDLSQALGPLIACAMVAAALGAMYLGSAGSDRIIIRQLIRQNRVCYTNLPPPSPSLALAPVPFKRVVVHSDADFQEFVDRFECFRPLSEGADCEMFCKPR